MYLSCTVALAMLVVEFPPTDEDQNPMRMFGTYLIVEMRAGSHDSTENYKDARVEISADRIVWIHNDERKEDGFEIIGYNDRVIAFDWIHTKNDGSEVRNKCIAKFEDGKLIICKGSVNYRHPRRPRSFSGEAKDGSVLMTLEPQ